MFRLRIKNPDTVAACKRQAAQVTKAFSATATVVASELRKAGRTDVRRAGKFGAWAFSVKTKRAGDARFIRSYAGSKVVEQLEFGQTIQGKPYLYIRLSAARPLPPRRAQKFPGELVRVERMGKPPVLVERGGEVKYFATSRVVMKKKLRLREAGRDAVKKVPTIYSGKLKQQKA